MSNLIKFFLARQSSEEGNIDRHLVFRPENELEADAVLAELNHGSLPGDGLNPSDRSLGRCPEQNWDVLVQGFGSL